MSSAPPTFEIGFVLAGAISAGCYSAGVMDFIIEALDDYYAEKDKPGWNGPKHDVQRFDDVIGADRRESQVARHLARVGENAVDLPNRQSGFVQRLFDRIDRQQQRCTLQAHPHIGLADSGDVGLTRHSHFSAPGFGRSCPCRSSQPGYSTSNRSPHWAQRNSGPASSPRMRAPQPKQRS